MSFVRELTNKRTLVLNSYNVTAVFKTRLFFSDVIGFVRLIFKLFKNVFY